MEAEEGMNRLAAMTQRAAYKAGLLDGIALGITGVTHGGEMENTRKGCFL
jgi:hypothetical protein